MATFFDTTDEEHLALLHSSVRAHDELDNAATAAERDVLDHFTIRTGVNTFRVELEGYDDDTPANSHETLVTALRWAIAKVVSFRLQRYDERTWMRSETLGDYRYERSGSGFMESPDGFPHGWDSELLKFNEKPVWYDI